MANKKMMETLEKLLNKMDEKDKAHQEALAARDEKFESLTTPAPDIFWGGPL